MSYIAALLLWSTVLSDTVRWGFWHGFERTVEPQPVMLAGASCATIGVQNLSKAERVAVLGGAEDVCAIFRSAAFAADLHGKSLLASCETDHSGEDAMPGDSVVALLRGNQPTFSVIIRKPFRAVGLTSRSPRDSTLTRVALSPAFYRRAGDPDRNRSDDFRGNLAHEWTHAASDRIMDGGHGKAQCPDTRLVSYVVGNLVARLWATSAPNQSR